MKVKTNIRAGQGANAGGVNAGGVNAGGGGGGGSMAGGHGADNAVAAPPVTVVYAARCTGI